MFVLGAEGDLICTPDDVRATAQHHNVDGDDPARDSRTC